MGYQMNLKAHFILNKCLSDKCLFTDDQVIIIVNSEDDLQMTMHSLTNISKKRNVLTSTEETKFITFTEAYLIWVTIFID